VASFFKTSSSLPFLIPPADLFFPGSHPPGHAGFFPAAHMFFFSHSGQLLVRFFLLLSFATARTLFETVSCSLLIPVCMAPPAIGSAFHLNAGFSCALAHSLVQTLVARTVATLSSPKVDSRPLYSFFKFMPAQFRAGHFPFWIK